MILGRRRGSWSKVKGRVDKPESQVAPGDTQMKTIFGAERVGRGEALDRALVCYQEGDD